MAAGIIASRRVRRELSVPKLPVKIRPGMTRLGRRSSEDRHLDGRLFAAALLIHLALVLAWIAMHRTPEEKPVPFALADVQVLFDHGQASIDPIPAPPPLPDAAPPVQAPAPVADELIPWPGSGEPLLPIVPPRPTGSKEPTLSGANHMATVHVGDGQDSTSVLTHRVPHEKDAPAKDADVASPNGTTGKRLSEAKTSAGQGGSSFSDGGASCATPAKIYPPLARQRGEEGIVYAGFSLAANGTVRNVRILRGSGHPILNDSTLSFLRGLRCSRPPSTPFNVIIMVSYNLITPSGSTMSFKPVAQQTQAAPPDAGTRENADASADSDAGENADSTAGIDQSGGR